MGGSGAQALLDPAGRTVRGKNESKTRRRCHPHLIITTTKMCTSPSTVFPVQRNHAVSCDTMNTYTSLKVHCI